MDFSSFVELFTETGVWCVTAYFLGKTLLDILRKDKEQAREDYKLDKERMYSFMDEQNAILSELKQLVNHQASEAEQSKEMLNRLTDIQMLHTNRLDRIEERLGRLEEKKKERE